MNEVVVYDNGELELKISIENETIWLTQKQIASLFEKDIRTINDHIKSIYKDEELLENTTIRKSRIVQKEGKREVTREVLHYNLDTIISVGYRVNSKKATKFRQWATRVLKQYITDGYAVNSEKITHQRFKELESDVNTLKENMQMIKSKIKDNTIAITQGVFYNGEVYDAYMLINDIFKTAKKSVVLIDNYIDDSVLTIFSKYPNLNFTIITQKLSKPLQLDIKKYNTQYKNLTLKISNKYHDRFLIIDNKEVYHIGASLKDLGKKVFAFSKIDKDMLKWEDDV